jgi:hypothetical protein
MHESMCALGAAAVDSSGKQGVLGMIEFGVEKHVVEAAVDYIAPILAKRDKRHPEWVRRRMWESIDRIVAGGPRLSWDLELGGVALSLALDSSRLGAGAYYYDKFEPQVIPFPSSGAKAE